MHALLSLFFAIFSPLFLLPLSPLSLFALFFFAILSFSSLFRHC